MAEADTQPEAPVAAVALDGGAVLKAMRGALGLSQERFAELVGMKRQQLSAYENGHHSPGLDTLREVAVKAGLRVEVTIRR